MDVFDLLAKISLDTSEYDNALDGASGKTSGFASKLGSGLKTAAKVGTAALAAASGAVAALTRQSLDGYADYEQLVGGVETLFKNDADIVAGYANNAYKTAGLSANEYMETVTSFSASLLQSLDGDTKKAAETADKAITDMSDNANKMGTSMESIQNAYQGFAKQNYTMLDNLKLGYGGTKEEMQRLLDKANEINAEQGIITDYQIDSYADIVNAIHAVQDEMGITGTTAKEAATTIQGSVASAKSAWENLVAGVGNGNADLGQLVDNLVENVGTAAENIMPRIVQILTGFGTAISRIAPVIGEQVPALVAGVLPSMVSAGAQLLVGLLTGIIGAVPELVSAVPEIVSSTAGAIIDNLPSIQAAGQELLTMFSDGVFSVLPDMINRLPEIIDGFLTFITDNLPGILDSGASMLNEFVTGIINGIPDMLSQLPQIIASFVTFIATNLPAIIQAGMDILANLVIGIIKNLPEIGYAAVQIIGAIVSGIGDLLGSVVDVGKNIVKGIWNGIVAMGSWIKEKVSGFFNGIVDGVKDTLGIHSPSRVFAGIGGNMALGLESGWENEFSKVKNDIEGGMNFGTATMDFETSGLGQTGRSIVGSVISGVASASSFGNDERDLVINLTAEIDGEVLIRKAYRYIKRQDTIVGESLAAAEA